MTLYDFEEYSGDALYEIARADWDVFMGKKYQAGHYEDEKEWRSRHFTPKGWKKFGQLCVRSKVSQRKAQSAVTLYSYYTVNGPYRNYWKRVMLLDGPLKGIVISV